MEGKILAYDQPGGIKVWLDKGFTNKDLVKALKYALKLIPIHCTVYKPMTKKAVEKLID